MPVVTPFLEGVKETAMPTLTKVAFAVSALLLGAGAAGGYYFASRKKIPTTGQRQLP
jgi:hypothetical protein